MLAIDPSHEHAVWQNNFAATPNVTQPGGLLTANATPHAKGSYSTIISSTTYDSYGFWVRFTNSSGVATLTDQLLDIAIGPSQQNIIVNEYQCGWASVLFGAPAPSPIWFPIFIPRGSLVSARIQSLIASDTVGFEMSLIGGASSIPGRLFSGCDGYGKVASTSHGTSHTPGSTGTESAFGSIGSTLSRNYGAVNISIQGTSTVMTGLAYHWELGVGGISLCEWYTQNSTNENIGALFPPVPFMISLPSGTQLQVRGEASGTAQDHYIMYHCFY